MCLGVPGRVVHMVEGYGNQLALVDVEGKERTVNVGILPEDTVLEPGDWVLIHMGFAMEKVDADGAARARSGLEMLRSGRET